MPDLYDDDDELMQLLDSGGKAPAVDLSALSAPSSAAGGGGLDADELDALLEDAVAQKSGRARLPAKGDYNGLRKFLKSDPRYRPWYDEFTKNYGGEPEVNDPDYDYHAAITNGVVPAPYKDASGKTTYHWASSTPSGAMLKSENHPTAWMEHFMRSTGIDPKDLGITSPEQGTEYLDKFARKGGADWRPAGAETGMDDDILNSLLESPKAPAPKDTAGIVMSDQDGQQAPFGVKDQRQDLTGNASRVAELYGQLEPEQQAGPGRHEQELNASWGSSDEEIQKAMRASAIMKALFDDDGGYGDRAKYLIEREKERAGRLSSARAADAAEAEKNRRVDQATAEMLVLAGVSPEAAVKARMGDPIVQLVRSTGGLGVKLRNQDTQVLNKNVGETGDVWKTLTEEQGKNARQDKQLDNNIQVAKLRKRQGKGGAGGGGENTALLSAFLQRNENVPPAIADAAVAGTLDTSDPNYAKLASAIAIYRGMGGDKQAQLLRGTLGREGGEGDKAAVSASVKQADPVQRLKLKNELTEIGMPLRSAVTGWNSLSPRAKELAVKIGLQGNISQLRDAGLSPQEQAAVGAVVGQINQYIKQVSGAAVSNSEWARMGAELGVTGEGVAPFKSTAALGAWLQRASALYKQRAANAASEYPGLFGGGQ